MIQAINPRISYQQDISIFYKSPSNILQTPAMNNGTVTHDTPKRSRWKTYFTPNGKLRPFRLLKQDISNLRERYVSDWTVFNQQVVASAVYIFFTNILPGITFASDLYVLTGQSWGTIEVVFSTGLVGVIFAM